MSLELISLFAFSALAAISGQVFAHGAGLANMASVVLLVFFGVLLGVRGLKKPVV